MQRGTTATLSMTGTNLVDPLAVWTSFPAKTSIPLDDPNGRAPTSLKVLLTPQADAPLGFHWVRVNTGQGISNLRLFCIDELVEIADNDKNHTQQTAQVITAPCVVVGRVEKEQNDYYRFTVVAGQRLSFQVLGRRLGSLVDPQITLFDARTGKEVPGGHNNDASGCQTDPCLSYTFKVAGDYILELRDVTYNGNPDFFYRLRIGEFPCASSAFPLAVQRGTKATIGFTGPSGDAAAPVELTVPADEAKQTLMLAPKGKSGLHGWPVPVRVSNVKELVEQEPNDDPTKATKLPVPCGVSGIFAVKADVDHFTFTLTKGQRVIIEAQTLELGSSAEVLMTLKDAKGTQLAASNPDAGPRIDYTATADGEVVLRAENLLSFGGMTETYRLTITPYEPGFDLAVALDRWIVAQGGTINIPIICTRRDYAGPIDVTIVGANGLIGTVNIPMGQPAKPGTPAATLAVKCDAKAPVGGGTFTIVGKATINNKPVEVKATYLPLVKTALANLPVAPPEIETQFAYAVTSGAEYTLAIAPNPLPLKVGLKTKLTITATRKTYMGPIVLDGRYLPADVIAPGVTIEAGKTSAEIEFTVGPKAMVGGKGNLVLLGVASEQGNQRQVVQVPFVIAAP